MKEYSVLNSNDKDWDNLINNSEQGSIFVEKSFLESISKNFKRYILKERNVTKAGIVLLLDKKKNKIISNKLQVYSGILFKHEKNASLTSKINDEIESSKILCEYLIKKYNKIEFCTHYNFKDLRPIQWLEFDQKIKNLNIKIKYTGLLNIESFNNYRNYTNNNYLILNKNRKEIIRNAERKKIIFKSTFSKDNSYLLESYKYMIKNNQMAWSKKDINELNNLTNNLLNKDKAVINYISDSDNNIVYSTLYSWHRDTAYYLYGGKKDKIKNDWSSTISHWEMFKFLSDQKKIKIVDLEGVNSPKRGHFKTSFGASIFPYYQIKFRKV